MAHSVLDESATVDGLVSGATLMDLAKAFERISLHHVWAAGLRHRFPLIVLRLMLGAFAFARTLSWKGALSEKVHTLSAVLAGGGFAQVALFLVLVDPLDRIQATYTIGVTLCLYVDDIAVHVVGSPENGVPHSGSMHGRPNPHPRGRARHGGLQATVLVHLGKSEDGRRCVAQPPRLQDWYVHAQNGRPCHTEDQAPRRRIRPRRAHAGRVRHRNSLEPKHCPQDQNC